MFILSGDVFATHSHPPPKPPTTWALTHFDDNLELVGSAGYHVTGLPADQDFTDPDGLPDSNPFGITKYLGDIDMGQFDGAMVM